MTAENSNETDVSPTNESQTAESGLEWWCRDSEEGTIL